MGSYKPIRTLDSFNDSEIESQMSNKLKSSYTVYLAAFSAFMHVVIMGFSVTYPAPAGVDMQKPNSRIYATEANISWIASIGAIASIIGSCIAGYISDKLGRKSFLLWSSVPFLASWMMIAYGSNMIWIYAGRFLSGLCVGMVAVVVPTYVTEISTPNIRGLLGSWFNVAFAMGSFMTMSFGAWLTWSWLAACGGILVVITLFFFTFMPESPIWSVTKGYYADGHNALVFLRGDSENASFEFQNINEQEEKNLNVNQSFNIKEILQPELYKPVLLCIGMMFFQQFCGINAVMTYNVEIFKRIENSVSPSVSSIIIASVQLLTTIICSPLMDRVGRRLMFAISGALAFFGLITVASFYYLTKNKEITSVNFEWVPLFGFILFIIAFNVGFGPIPWIMAPEMVPTNARSTVVGITSVSAGIFMFVVVKTFTRLRFLLNDYGVYLFYGIISFIGCFFCYFLPETKGKTLEDIQRYFKIK